MDEDPPWAQRGRPVSGSPEGDRQPRTIKENSSLSLGSTVRCPGLTYQLIYLAASWPWLAYSGPVRLITLSVNSGQWYVPFNLVRSHWVDVWKGLSSSSIRLNVWSWASYISPGSRMISEASSNPDTLNPVLRPSPLVCSGLSGVTAHFPSHCPHLDGVPV